MHPPLQSLVFLLPRDSYPRFTILRLYCFQCGIDGILHQVDECLLYLVGIGKQHKVRARHYPYRQALLQMSDAFQQGFQGYGLEPRRGQR